MGYQKTYQGYLIKNYYFKFKSLATDLSTMLSIYFSKLNFIHSSNLNLKTKFYQVKVFCLYVLISVIQISLQCIIYVIFMSLNFVKLIPNLYVHQVYFLINLHLYMFKILVKVLILSSFSLTMNELPNYLRLNLAIPILYLLLEYFYMFLDFYHIFVLQFARKVINLQLYFLLNFLLYELDHMKISDY